MNSDKAYRISTVGASSITLTPADTTDAAADISTVVLNFSGAPSAQLYLGRSVKVRVSLG